MPLTTIKIFGTSNSPYARLSDNFRQDMTIDNKTWPTVTNYIYASILRTPIYRTIMRNAETKKSCTGGDQCSQHRRSRQKCEAAGCQYQIESITQQFRELWDKEIRERMVDSFSTALTAKFEENQKLKEKLLATGIRPIIYVSPNAWLGIGDGKGKNKYGRLLQAIRNRLQSIQNQEITFKNQEARDKALYDAYLAFINLQRQIKDGNSLDDYQGKKPAKILEIMASNGIDILRPFTSETVAKEARRSKVSTHKSWINQDVYLALNNPKVLTALVQSKEIRSYRVNQIRRAQAMVLDMFMDYLLKREYPEVKPEQYALAKKQQLDQLLSKDPTMKSKIQIRLYSLYEKGMLSASLSDEIEKAIETLNIPTEEQVDEAENFGNAIRESAKKETKEQSRPYVPVSGDPVLVYPSPPLEKQEIDYSDFSPLDTSFKINIDGRVYPSVTYYVIARRLSDTSRVNSIGNAYTIIKNSDGLSFKDLEILEREMDWIIDTSYATELKESALIALRTKFENRVSQNILLATGNSRLVWDDRKDPILGTGEPGKENFIGITLEKIRSTLRKDRKDEEFDKLTPESIHEVFNDDFLRGWFNMRVRDMCNVVVTMKDYLYLKYDINQRIDPSFVRVVLDDVYQPCSHIFAAAAQITVAVPQQFTNMVKDYRGFSSLVTTTEDWDKILEIMWKRLAVVIYYFVKYIKVATSFNIGMILKRIEGLTSRPKNCAKIIPDREENCIFGAILNILRGIIKFNKRLGRDSETKEIDFNAVSTILLNVSSLSEQRAEQRRMMDKPPIIVVEEKVDDKIDQSELEELADRLRGGPGFYSDEVIEKVIHDVQELGSIPDEIDLIALHYEVEEEEAKKREEKEAKKKKKEKKKKEKKKKKKEPDMWDLFRKAEEEEKKEEKVSKRHRRPRLRARIKPKATPSTDEESEDSDWSEYDMESEDEKEELELIPSPQISKQILIALKEIGVSEMDNDQTMVFIVDECIRFIKAYPMSSRVKTNRINFFASSEV